MSKAVSGFRNLQQTATINRSRKRSGGNSPVFWQALYFTAASAASSSCNMFANGRSQAIWARSKNAPLR